MAKKDPAGLAFLDMLSCALGAVILLFLIFATFQHQGIPRPGRNQPQPELAEKVATLAVGRGETDPSKTAHLWRLSYLGNETPPPVPENIQGPLIVMQEPSSPDLLLWLDQAQAGPARAFQLKGTKPFQIELAALVPGKAHHKSPQGRGFKLSFTAETGWHAKVTTP